MNNNTIVAPPLITIITVVYNGGRYLEQTIQSVLALSYPSLNYIVIDGGSTDDTIEIIKQHSDRIAYWTSEKDRGIYDAMNKGWAAAKEGFILFLGAGDRIVSLPKNMERFTETDVICGNVQVGEDRLFRSRPGFLMRFFNQLHHQALLVRKQTHPEVPFDLQFRTYADFDFNQRLYKQGVRFAYADDLVGYALPGGFSSRFAVRESFRVVRKNYGLLHGLVFLLLYAGSKMLNPLFPSKPFSAMKTTRS